MYFIIACLLLFKSVFAQGQIPIMSRVGFGIGQIVEVKDIPVTEMDTQFGAGVSQEVKLKMTSGFDVGKVVDSNFTTQTVQMKADIGQYYVVDKANIGDTPVYNIIDRYRLYPLAVLGIGFILLVVFMAGKKGIGSLLGFASTLFVLVAYAAPNLLAGKDPVFVAFMACGVIASLSMFLSHGVSRRTFLAYFSTMFLLVLSVGMSGLFVQVANLTGAGTEDAFFLASGSTASINLRGVLLAGIIIGIMGVLDDITTAQTAAVDEIHKANPSLRGKELYLRGLSVGKEHIASLVNTLMLAYAGASLPLFLLFNLNATSQPLWMMLNSEMIAEEIVRTLVGSTILVLAVPISTFIAALGVSRHRD